MDIFQRILGPVVWSLRTWWKSALTIAVCGIATLAATLPLSMIVAPRSWHLVPLIRLAPIQGSEPSAGSPTSIPLSWVRELAIRNLTELVVTITCGLVLVALCTTLTIMWSRSCARGRELAIRRAAGASWRVLRAAEVLEGSVIALPTVIIGGAVGLLLGVAARQAWPGVTDSPAMWPAAVTLGAVCFGIVCSGTVMHFKGGAIASKALPGETRIGLTIPVVQLAVTVAILVVGELISGYTLPRDFPRGSIADDAVVTLTSRASGETARAHVYQQMLAGAGQAANDSAVLASPGMVLGLGNVDVVWTECGRCATGGIPTPIEWDRATQYFVGRGGTSWLGPRLLEGRLVSATDTLGASEVAVISRSLTRRFEAGKALGRGFTVGSLLTRYKAVRYVVVGVVEDQSPAGFGGALLPGNAVYLSILQHPTVTADLVVPGNHLASVRAVLARDPTLARELTVSATNSLPRVVATDRAPLVWFGRVVVAESWLMAVLAVLGAVVMIHLWVESWVPELGVMVSVGATRRSVRLWVVVKAIGVGTIALLVSLWLGIVLWGDLPDTITGLRAWQPRLFLQCGIPVVMAVTLTALGTVWRAIASPPAQVLGADDA